MDLQDRIAEAFFAPVGSALLVRDTRVIEREGWYQTITPSSGSTAGNEVACSRLPAAEIEDVIDRTIAEYAAAGVPFKWSVGPLTEPQDTGERLARRGFTSWDVRGMAIDPAAWRASMPAGVTVEPVARDNLDEFRACWAEGWEVTPPDPVAWNDDQLRALATGRFSMVLARVAGEPAGTAGAITKPRSVYLVGGNVLARHRGRGVYRALLASRLARAAAAGVTLATTQAREATSAPILERLGFESLFRGRIYRTA